MGILDKFSPSKSMEHPSTPLRSTTPTTDMTEMTDYSSSAYSRESSILSSGSSIVSSARSSYSSRKGEKAWVHDINKHGLMAKHLYRNCKKNNWLEEKANEACIALRTFQGEYILFPPDDKGERYQKAIKGLNVEVLLSQLFRADNRSVSELIRMLLKSS